MLAWQASPGTPWTETILGVLGTVLGLYLSARIIAILNRVRRKQAVIGDMPGPTAIPIVGNILDLYGPAETFWERMKTLVAAHAPTFRFWAGPELFVVLTDPRDFEFILSNPKFNDKSTWYPLAVPALGTGLIVLSGEPWKRHRKAVAPSLHQRVLEQNVEVFRRKAETMAQRMEQYASSGQSFDVKAFCDLACMDAVCETLLSANLSEYAEALKKFVDEKNRCCELVVQRVHKPWLLCDWIFSTTKSGRESRRIDQLTDRFIDGVIKDKRAEYARRPEDALAPGRRRAFLEHALGDSSVATLMSDKELREEAKAMVIAGEGTVSASLSFTLYMLARHQPVQNRVLQEIDDTLGPDVGRVVTEAELPHLEYLERVVLETLRMFPLVSAFGRNCPEDTHLPSGYTAPQGAHLLFYSYYTHHDPRWYPEPYTFDPDRFLPEAVRARPPMSYVPFSAGARSCIGQKYAIMLLKTMLCSVLRQYRLLPAPGDQRPIADLPIEIAVIISIRGGFPVRVQRRQPGGKEYLA